jgi:hypothetical protein
MHGVLGYLLRALGLTVLPRNSVGERIALRKTYGLGLLSNLLYIVDRMPVDRRQTFVEDSPGIMQGLGM